MSFVFLDTPLDPVSAAWLCLGVGSFTGACESSRKSGPQYPQSPQLPVAPQLGLGPRDHLPHLLSFSGCLGLSNHRRLCAHECTNHIGSEDCLSQPSSPSANSYMFSVSSSIQTDGIILSSLLSSLWSDVSTRAYVQKMLQRSVKCPAHTKFLED